MVFVKSVPSDCHATQTTSNFNPFVNTRVRIVRLQRGESWCLSGLKIAGQRLGKLYPATFNSETVKLDLKNKTACQGIKITLASSYFLVKKPPEFGVRSRCQPLADNFEYSHYLFAG